MLILNLSPTYFLDYRRWRVYHAEVYWQVRYRLSEYGDEAAQKNRIRKCMHFLICY